MALRFWLVVGNGPEREVTEGEYIAAEHLAGHHDTLGVPDHPKTLAFGGQLPDGRRVSGRRTHDSPQDLVPELEARKKAEREEVIRLFDEGMSPPDISSRMHIGENCIHRWLVRAGRVARDSDAS